MWIFSSLGFFSITRTPDGQNLHFRARKEQDAQNLKDVFPQFFVGRDVLTIEHADYRFRIETTPELAGQVMAALTQGIEYRNFKSYLEKTDQADKLGILHDLWHELHEYQNEQLLAGAWHEQPGQRLLAGHHRREALRRHQSEESPRELFPDYLSQAAANEEAIEHGDEESEEVVQFFPIGGQPPERDEDDANWDEETDSGSTKTLPEADTTEQDLAAAADEGWPDDEDDSDGSGM